MPDPSEPPAGAEAQEPVLSAGPVRRAILRGLLLGVGSSLVFLVAILGAGGGSLGALLSWGFLVGLVATPIAFVEISSKRWATRSRLGAFLVGGLVLLLAWLGVSAGWVQANWTLSMLVTGDVAQAFLRARKALGQIFDHEGIPLSLSMACPFALTAFSRLRAWPLWGQGLLTFVVSLLTVGLFALAGLLEGQILLSVCAILAGGLGFVLPLACAGTDALERLIWGGSGE